MWEYAWGDHTVFDLLKIFSQMSPASRYRERYIRNARRQLLAIETAWKEKVPEAYRLFVQGLWGVMKGGLSLVEDGHTQMWEYGWGDHTVFDLLKIFSQMSPASRYRETFGRK